MNSWKIHVHSVILSFSLSHSLYLSMSLDFSIAIAIYTPVYACRFFIGVHSISFCVFHSLSNKLLYINKIHPRIHTHTVTLSIVCKLTLPYLLGEKCIMTLIFIFPFENAITLHIYTWHYAVKSDSGCSYHTAIANHSQIKESSVRRTKSEACVVCRTNNIFHIPLRCIWCQIFAKCEFNNISVLLYYLIT